MNQTIVQIAQELATRYHQGQFRRITPGQQPLPYIIHPAKVVYYLKKYGIEDEEVHAAGWLHDTVEDTALTLEEIEETFGKRVARMVHAVTRDVDNDAYKRRIGAERYEIQMTKLCDVLHNTKTLHLFSPSGINRKVEDITEFYLPLAEKICPALAADLQRYFEREMGIIAGQNSRHSVA